MLAPHAGRSEFEHQGQRVVVGQRLMQAASDMFLGWTSYWGHEYYVRQYRDVKGSVNLDAMALSGTAKAEIESSSRAPRPRYSAIVAKSPDRVCARASVRPHTWA